MKAVFEALATYNLKVDESLLDILEKLGEDKMTASSGAYFPTVYDQLKHIFGSHVNWIKRLKAAFPKSAALAKSRFADFDVQSLKAPFSEAGSKLFADLREIDRSILALAKEFGETELAAAITYKNYKGEDESHELWKCLLHWFNHATHHRGSISGQLDAMGIENDFSSLLPKV